MVVDEQVVEDDECGQRKRSSGRNVEKERGNEQTS